MCSSATPIRIAVVCEGPADFDAVATLVDRVITHNVAWIEQAEHFREFVTHRGFRYVRWASVRDLYRELNMPPVRGHFDGKPGEPDAQNALRAIRLCLRSHDPLHGIVLLRDQDHQPERLAGMAQARDAADHPVQVVIGLAIVMRENWVISGFDAKDETEVGRVASIETAARLRLHLDCHAFADRNETSLRSPKQVVKTLTNFDRDRESHCLAQTPLETLRERGSSNGLADFLNDVETRLVPLFTGDRH